jgi:hypothetical protein
LNFGRVNERRVTQEVKNFIDKCSQFSPDFQDS